ncbi:hypothetical protein SFRURICE_011832 [Spodoptera frugiperda]|nr:hypothetical protein SFRURICE_011832 [Spodoptera frugiperda]
MFDENRLSRFKVMGGESGRLAEAGDDFVDEKAILARRMHSLRVVTELSKAPTCGQIASVGADSFDETDTSRPTTNARPNVGTNAIF